MVGLRVTRLQQVWLQAPSALATPAVIGRVIGAMYAVGGIHGAIIASQIATDSATPVVYSAAALATAIGIATAVWGYRLSLVHYEILALLGCVSLAFGLTLVTDDAAAVGLASFAVCIGVSAALFFAWTHAVVINAVAVACVVVGLGARHNLTWAAGIVAAAGTLLIAGSVGILSRFASDANVDSLTGLLNRRGFDHQLGFALADAKRSGGRPVLVLFDLDRFKWINDSQGHHVGDAVLRKVADVWRSHIDKTMMLARYGGDEFALLLPEATEDEAVALSERLRASISTGCSAGVTSWRQGESGSLLVGRADIALYKAKHSGGSQTAVQPVHASAVASELRKAIEQADIAVHYAPIVRLGGDGDIVGYEALMRWRSGADPGITPAEAIRVAEGHDLIAALDRIVLERACREVAEFAQRSQRAFLHVNVSGRELAERNYVATVEEILKRTRWPAGLLVLEVQEAVFDYETPAVVRNLRALRDRGICIAIDDFGGGYSSLSQLETLPIDMAKVNRKFVAAATQESAGPSLIGVVAALADALDLPVIARGVENSAQVEALIAHGYQFAQGSLFGEAQPADAFGR
ncbi:putative bifunctional diguanylate cyclase/phosphodiesterase [Antrihabitans stalactiti]|uniref:EAL domain-containing protein n=1 Tax=Antrihabitans stalactiti TaxID=2584121 RepID=A0A848KL79_9NOCA|nr:EAL domain-containing protein [Antrihabitans stalactiti]NMN97422.1 EAL domain-containing protein [Antrihabitans stalactiti]